MSVHEPPQFTPAQVLDAARRAEAEGRADYAQQFYRHLVEKYPASGEAAMARTSLSRMGMDPGPHMAGFGSPVMSGAGQMAPPPYDPSRLEPEPPSLGNPFDPRPPEQAGWQQPYAPAYAQPQQIPPPPQSYEHPVELPEESRRYLLGRFLARFVAWFGVIHLIAGLALIPLSIAGPRALQTVPTLGLYLSSPTYGLTLVVLGVTLLLLGQVARALLDQSNATQDMAAILRAEAEAKHGAPARSRRR